MLFRSTVLRLRNYQVPPPPPQPRWTTSTSYPLFLLTPRPRLPRRRERRSIVQEHSPPCPHQHPVLPLPHTSSDVRSGRHGHGRIPQRLPSESRQSTRCRPSDCSYSRSPVMCIPRLFSGWILPSRLERASSVDRPHTRTRSSACLSNRSSHPHCRWHTIWRVEGVPDR